MKAYLLDEHTVTIGPFFSNAIGFIKLVVAKADAGLASTLIDTFENELATGAKCPKCGSTGFLPVAKASNSNTVTAVLTWLFSSYAVAPEKVFSCPSCGFETSTPPENQTETQEQ